MTVFTPKSLAERWECSAGTVYSMIERGELLAFKVGDKLLRIRGDVVEAFECQGGDLQDAQASSASHGTTTPGFGAATNSEPTTIKKRPASPLLSTRERRDLLDRR